MSVLVCVFLIAWGWSAGLFDSEPLMIIGALEASLILGFLASLRERDRAGPVIIIGLFFGLGLWGSHFGGWVGSTLLFYANALVLAAGLLGRLAMWAVTAASLLAHFGLAWATQPLPLAASLPSAIPTTGALLGIAFLVDFVLDALQRAVSRLQLARQSAESEAAERAQAQAELREREQIYRVLVEQASDVIFTVGLDQRYVFVNPAGVRLSGYSAEELRAMRYTDLVPPEHQARVRFRFLRQFKQGNPITYGEHPFRTRAGELVWLGVNVSLLNEGGRATGFHVIGRDITERRQSEETLRHAQKRESLGIMAGGVAHDFNNLLQVIQGSVGLALRRLPSDDPAARILLNASSATSRASELTRQLLDYSGRGIVRTEPLLVGELVKSMARLIEISLPRSARLSIDIADGLPPVHADRGQVQQVVINLVVNAGEAVVGRGGAVTVTVRRERVEPGDTAWGERTLSPVAPGNYVLLQIEDDGAGMSPATMERIFDPFFTTKFTGRGLGLAAVLGIVRTHRGGLRVESSEGRGSRFRIVLPAIR